MAVRKSKRVRSKRIQPSQPVPITLCAITDRLHHVESVATVISELCDTGSGDKLKEALAVTVLNGIVRPLRAEIAALDRVRELMRSKRRG